MHEIRVLAPATVANVVCGFDCLGFALEEPKDEMILRKTDSPGISIKHNDAYGLTTNAELNVAGVALRSFMQAADVDHGCELEITKHIMPGSGIGSSASREAGAIPAGHLRL